MEIDYVESDDENHQEGEGGDWGFHVDEEVVEEERLSDERKKANEQKKKDNIVEFEQIKRDINNILLKYPTIKIRSTSDVLRGLDDLGLEELKNIYANAVNDVIDLRGTPAAEFFIVLSTHFIDRHILPGIQEECLNDIDLVRDFDSIVNSKMGFMPSGLNVLFRIANNVSNVLRGKTRAARKRTRDEYESRKPNTTDTTTTANQEENASSKKAG